MSVLPILIGADHPMLRKKTKPVAKVTKEILKLLKDMQETVKDADGAGIAAPQIGRTERICLALISGKMIPLINPKITAKSKEQETAEEGCLSLPGIAVSIPRSVEITLKYMDAKGKPQERKLRDFDARVVQHEVDHLEGVLIVDYAQNI
ncbi:peptide deformylase [Candidatus Peribacteria bacterium RIFCSPHIGHO2_02_FULL_53_20]|nr:MAG: peptide deformylase [Candidatus Peribacteria bacterium RIFCSPHIGHO2_02_FULL_53_20]OGJ67501.1 MAG: peptide deformylase [Candidatus Peribacteria bacterium RIFCSPLOWO2_01_FULL_53_10]OGJ69813.1 MAG: peptide deformylase [Candidatus Peribacteria bacterium RIFCSPLOWO2_12_FULL_53_10]